MRRTPCMVRPTSRARVTMTCVLLGAAFGVVPLAAQVSQDPLDRVARLDVEGVTIDVALRTLLRNSGASIAFSPDLLPAEARVTCHCMRLSVRQALDRLLEGTALEYRTMQRQVLIVRSSSLRTGLGESPRGVLEGQVVVLPGSQPLAEASVTVRAALDPGADSGGDRPETTRLQTDRDGRFSLSLAPGRYDVVVSAFGFGDGGEDGVVVQGGARTRITARLSFAPFPLEEIVVAPSTFGMLGTQAPSAQILTRQDLESLPHPGNDIIRAVEQLPGVSTSDYTAKPFVRGARAEEVLTILDGLELHEPYHLKYWDGSLSIVDVETIGAVSLATGGFTSEYGGRSAGVLTMRTADPPVGPPRTTLGLDLLSSIVKSEGTFHEGRGSWLASARRGFLGFVFDLMNLYQDEDLHPSYYDLFSRVQYEVRPGHRVSAHLLHAGDETHGLEADGTDYRMRYANSYAWLNWEADFSRDLGVRTVTSLGRVAQHREGSDPFDQGVLDTLRVDDEDTATLLGLRQDWLWRASPRMMLKWGFDLMWGSADYDYYRADFVWVPNLTAPWNPVSATTISPTRRNNRSPRESRQPCSSRLLPRSGGHGGTTLSPRP